MKTTQVKSKKFGIGLSVVVFPPFTPDVAEAVQKALPGVKVKAGGPHSADYQWLTRGTSDVSWLEVMTTTEITAFTSSNDPDGVILVLADGHLYHYLSEDSFQDDWVHYKATAGLF